MNRIIALLLVLVAGTTAPAAPRKATPKETSKQRLMLFGKGFDILPDRDVYNPDPALSLFVQTTPADKPIILIGWDAKYLSKNNATNRAYIGIVPYIQKQEVKQFKRAPETATEIAELVEAIKSAGGIMLSGSNPEDLMNGLKDPSIVEALKMAYEGGTTIAGMEAGARIMGTLAIVDQKRDEKEKKILRTIKGLGLLKAPGMPETIVEDQFNKRREWARSDFYFMEYGYSLPPLLQGMREHNAIGIALDAGSALIVRDGHQMSVMSDMDHPYSVRVFTDHQKSALEMVSTRAGYYNGEPAIIIENKKSFDLNKAVPGIIACKNAFK